MLVQLKNIPVAENEEVNSRIVRLDESAVDLQTGECAGRRTQMSLVFNRDHRELGSPTVDMVRSMKGMPVPYHKRAHL